METYPRTKVPKAFRGLVPGEKVSVPETLLKTVLDDIKRDSSAGVPLVYLAKLKGEVIEEHSAMLMTLINDRLTRLNSCSHEELCKMSPVDLVLGGFCDPIRVFIKNEPHSPEKVISGRLRLIACVSIIDEAVERLLCGVQNMVEITEWENIPSKAGISLRDQDAMRRLHKECSKYAGLAETDVSGYDWSLQGWLFELEAAARIKLCGASPNSAYARILSNRLRCLSFSVLATSDGQVFSQMRPGVMKSGSYLTSSSNSRIRAMAAYALGSLSIIAMGDDSVEDNSREDLHDAYDKVFGFIIKEVARPRDGTFQFCSHEFSAEKARPLNAMKGLFRLLSNAPDRVLYEQFKGEFGNSDDFDRCIAVIAECGWSSEISLIENVSF